MLLETCATKYCVLVVGLVTNAVKFKQTLPEPCTNC